MSYIDVTGKTEDEAISKALAQLGLDRDDVSVEILERAKSGFLGLGSSAAEHLLIFALEHFHYKFLLKDYSAAVNHCFE